jgi:hypothetical protein
MKSSRISICLVLFLMIVFPSKILRASSPSRTMAKVHFEPYTGPQQDWPRSTERVTLLKMNHGMPIYERFPDRAYEVLGAMSDNGEHSVKHVAEAGRVAGADAILVVGDKAFTEAGLNANPHLLDHADIPDPKGPKEITRLEHPEALKTGMQPSTIQVTEIVGILIRWKTR